MTLSKNLRVQFEHTYNRHVLLDGDLSW